MLGELEARPDLIDAYVSLKAQQGLCAKTIHNQLHLLHLMLRKATVWRLIQSNPVTEIERPRLAAPETPVLTSSEVSRLCDSLELLSRIRSERERDWWLLARAITLVTLATALRRGELLALRWHAVDLQQRTLDVREALVRGRFTTPKSKASRRIVDIGPRTAAVLEEHHRRTHFTQPLDLVFCHPARGTPLDPAALARNYLKPALAHAGINQRFRPFHDLRHTSLTHTAAAGNPAIYVQARAGHASAAMTERYLHPIKLAFPGAAERSERQIFGKRRIRPLLRRSSSSRNSRDAPREVPAHRLCTLPRAALVAERHEYP